MGRASQSDPSTTRPVGSGTPAAHDVSTQSTANPEGSGSTPAAHDILAVLGVRMLATGCWSSTLSTHLVDAAQPGFLRVDLLDFVVRHALILTCHQSAQAPEVL